MRALVTGATGFIGRHLVRRLIESRWTTAALVRASSSAARVQELRAENCQVFEVSDSTESVVSTVRDARADVVFHLATYFVGAHTAGDLDALMATNVVFGTRVLESLRAAGHGAMVSIGTRWQHYENAAYAPLSLYGATKEAFEQIARYYTDVAGVPVIALHLTDCYGPFDERRKLVDWLLEAARTGTPLAMTSGEQSIDLLHVSDATRAIEVAGRHVANRESHANFERYVARSGRSLTIRELVTLVERVREIQIPVQWGKRPYRARETFGAWEGGTPLPAWAPEILLEDGLRALP